MQESVVGLGEFFHILRRRIGLIVSSLVLCFALALAYAILASPSYTATATIVIDPRERAPIGSDQLPPNQSPDLVRAETQVKLLTSEPVIRRAVENLNLLDDPSFGKPGLIRSMIIAMFGDTPDVEREKRLQALVISLADAATVRRSERTYIFELDVKGRTAKQAAMLANGIAEAYIEEQMKVSEDFVRRQSQIVSERLVDLQLKVQESENRVQDYRAQNGVVASGGVLVNEQQLTETSKLLAAAKAKTAEARGRNEQVQRILKSGQSVASIPEALRSTAIEKLRLQVTDLRRQEANLRVTYGDRHPALIEVREQLRPIQAQLDAELRRIGEASSNELQAAIANERDVERQVAQLKANTTSIDKSLLTLRELEREAAANRAVYERLLKGREMLRNDLSDPPLARISSPALPPLKATSPRILAAMIAALAGGLAIGCGSALILDHNERFRRASVQQSLVLRAAHPAPSPDPAPEPAIAGETIAERDDAVFGSRMRALAGGSNRRSTDIAITRTAEPAPAAAQDLASASPVVTPVPQRGAGDAIAVLPRLSSAGAEGQRHAGVLPLLTEVRRNGDSSFSRAIRQLCASILDDYESADVVRILITSLEPSTGKSVLAANLAQAAAEVGERVLLIDANSAHPTVSTLAQSSHSPVLIDLSGTLRLTFEIWSGAGSLNLIPLSPAERRITRRLARDGETDQIDGINGNFDIVIVDGPVATDEGEAIALVRASDDVIVVAGEATTLADITPVLRRMRAQGKFRGVVRVEEDREVRVA